METAKQLKRFWMSWVQPTEDYRPLTDPPNENVLGWWCSGYDSNDQAILVALVQAKDEYSAKVAVVVSWPELIPDGEWRFCKEVANNYVPGDRFPMKEWERKRILAGFTSQ